MDGRDARTRDLGGDEVLDFPGLPGEDEGIMTNSVSADAYLALKSAFKELKGRYLESEQRCRELSKQRSKKKGTTDSALVQAYHERDEILKKSYAAFQEKYAENEELQKKLEEMRAENETLKMEYNKKEEELKKKSERLVNEIAKISEDLREKKNEVEQLRILSLQDKEEGGYTEGTPEVEEKCSQTSFETLTLNTLLKRMEDFGLQVTERYETLIVLVTDKGKLRDCLETCADEAISSFFERFLSEGNPETKTFYSPEEFNVMSRKHMEAEGKVIRLKQKIGDQAQEIRRLRKLCSDVMHQHSKCNKEKQKTLENEAKDLQRNLEEGAVSKERTDGGVARLITEMEKPASEKRFGDLLRKVVAITAQLNELYKELDTQGRCVQQLLMMTQTSTRTLSAKAKESYESKRQFLTEKRHDTGIDNLLGGHLAEDDAQYMSIPVQETEPGFLARNVGAPPREIIPHSSEGVAPDEEAGGESRVEELGRPVEEEPPFSQLARAPPVEGASGRSRRHGELVGSTFEPLTPSFSGRVERVEWTGESDIEVIEESDQQNLGATSMQGRLCPVCDSHFPSNHSQGAFEQHVRSHFDD